MIVKAETGIIYGTAAFPKVKCDILKVCIYDAEL